MTENRSISMRPAYAPRFMVGHTSLQYCKLLRGKAGRIGAHYLLALRPTPYVWWGRIQG